MLLGTRLFTSGEVQRLVGISQQHLTYWDQSGLLRPSGREAQGRGSRRMFTVLDVLQLKLIRRLRDEKLPLQRIRKAIATLSAMTDEPVPLAELEVVTDGTRILLTKSNADLLELSERQYFLRLPLSALLAEVEAGIESLREVTSVALLRSARSEEMVSVQESR
jgi:DNA-binding transcriptional MerR regulator